jgi:sulfite exporter TauE/SafE
VIPKALGIACFSVENGKSVTKLKDVSFFLISILMGILVGYFSVLIRSDLVEQQSRIANIGNFLAFIASVFIIILSLLITFIFRHKIWNLAQKLDDIEVKVRI